MGDLKENCLTRGDRSHPTIGFPRSTCTIYRPKGMGLGVASDTGRRGSMKDTVGVGKSYPCLGGTYTLSPHSFYLLCFYAFSPMFHLTRTHTKVYFSRRLL